MEDSTFAMPTLTHCAAWAQTCFNDDDDGEDDDDDDGNN